MKTIVINYNLIGERTISLNGNRTFTCDKEAEKFLDHLALLKAKIAMRANGNPAKKRSDILKGYRIDGTRILAHSYSKLATNSMWNYPSKLSVNIKTH